MRAYEGEVESAVVGRVGRASASGWWSGGRQGFAYAGHARRDGHRRDPGRGPRQRHLRHARRARGPGRPDGVAPASLDLWDDALSCAADQRPRSRWRSSSSAGSAAATPGSARSTFADYGDMAAEAAVATLHRHHGHRPAHASAACRSAGHRRRRRRQPDRGGVQRRHGVRADVDSRQGGRRRHRAGHPDARAPPRCKSGRCVVVLDPRVTVDACCRSSRRPCRARR